MNTAPKGYRPATTNKGDARDDFYREIEPTAADVIEALAVLPPDTAIETMAGEGGVDTPSGVWYNPAAKTAAIG